MKVKWLGHASFLITSDNGLKILTDPYEPGFRGIISYAPIREVPDIVTVSHHHGDHDYIKCLKGKAEVVEGVGSRTVRGVEFVGVPSYHDRKAGAERGPNTIFCFAVDAVHVCHLGDLGHPLDEATIQSLGRVDMLLTPTGGPPATLDLNEAAALWERLKPSVVIPMHFRNQKCTFPRYGAEEMLKAGAEIAGSPEVEFAASNLPRGKLLVLDPAL